MPLESIVQKTSKISLSRIGWNSFWSGILGSFYEPSPYSGLGGALVGFSLTLSDCQVLALNKKVTIQVKKSYIITQCLQKTQKILVLFP